LFPIFSIRFLTKEGKTMSAMQKQVVRLIQAGYSTQSIWRQTGVDQEKIAEAREVLKYKQQPDKQKGKPHSKAPANRVNSPVGLSKEAGRVSGGRSSNRTSPKAKIKGGI
jgi:hypothetical protein